MFHLPSSSECSRLEVSSAVRRAGKNERCAQTGGAQVRVMNSPSDLVIYAHYFFFIPPGQTASTFSIVNDRDNIIIVL